MKALTIRAQTQSIEPIDLEIQANTIYTFFNSILTDELTTLNGHVIYTDANAISEQKQAYFLGEQLLVGDALIFAREDFNDADVIITAQEVQSLITYEVSDFYRLVLELLAKSDLNLYRTFTLSKGDESMTLNAEWVLYAFNMADERTKDYFTEELRKVLNTDTKGVDAYMKKMAGLAISAAGE